MALLFSGDFEQGAPKPWSPFPTCQCHNADNPNDTPHSSFGTFSRSSVLPYKGRYSGRTVLDRYDPLRPYQRGECMIGRGNPAAYVGTTDYHLLAYKFMPGFVGGQFLISELGWQAPHPPTIGLRLRPDHITLVLQTGRFDGTRCAYQSNADLPPSSYVNLPPVYARPPGAPIEPNIWHEIIVGKRWAIDRTGWVKCWHRLRNMAGMLLGWQSASNMQLQGVPTLQLNRDGTLPNYWEDTIGPYRQSNRQQTWIEYEMSRFDTLAAAMAYAG